MVGCLYVLVYWFELNILSFAFSLLCLFIFFVLFLFASFLDLFFLDLLFPFLLYLFFLDFLLPFPLFLVLGLFGLLLGV